jgi:hypothetical protein
VVDRVAAGGDSRPGLRKLWVFLAVFALMACLTHRRVFLAGNDASRLAQIEALVDLGHTHIGESRYAWTVDRVTIDGRDYSNKPPFLSLIGAGVYAVVERACGLSFARHEAATVYLLTLILIGGSTAWLCARFYGELARLYPGAAERARLLSTAALAAGTILATFSTTFNNHTPAAACLFAACCAAWNGRSWRAGTWLALTALIDPAPGLVFAPLLAVVLAGAAARVKLKGYLLALALAVAAFAGANAWISGYPLPPKMAPGAVDHSSGFAASVAGVLLPDDPWYPIACLFGWHGFFSVSPVLLLGAAGLAAAIRAGRPLPRRSSAALAIGCAVMIGGHAALAGSYGGWSYGFRYLIPVVPLLLFFAPPLVERLGNAIVLPLLLVSAVTASIGAYHPWPPGYEQEAGKDPVASIVVNPIGGNLAAWVNRYWPGSALGERLGAAFISPDPELRRRYLWLFYRSKGDRVGTRLMESPPQGARGAARDRSSSRRRST